MMAALLFRVMRQGVIIGRGILMMLCSAGAGVKGLN